MDTNPYSPLEDLILPHDMHTVLDFCQVLHILKTESLIARSSDQISNKISLLVTTSHELKDISIYTENPLLPQFACDYMHYDENHRTYWRIDSLDIIPMKHSNSLILHISIINKSYSPCLIRFS